MRKRASQRVGFLFTVLVVAGMFVALARAATPSPGYDIAPLGVRSADASAQYEAINDAQRLRATFDATGMRFKPKAAGGPPFELGLVLTGFDGGEGRTTLPAPTLGSEGPEVSYDYGGIVERIRNTELGLETSFTIESSGRSEDGALLVDLAVTGNLVGKLSDNGDAVDFLTSEGVPVLRWAKLRATDASQHELGLAMIEANVKGSNDDRGVRLIVKDGDATYPITVRTIITAADAKSSVATAPGLASAAGVPDLAPNATVLLSPTGDGGFENGATFAANGWTVVNHATNTWQVGTVAVPFAGINSGYVSNNGGAAYAYTNSASQTSHFYRDLTVPAGETAVTLSFQLKVTGESGFDRLLVYTAPTSVTPVAGTPASSSTTLAGATLAYTGVPLSGTSYTSQTVTLPTSLAGTTFRLIFTWQNDGSLGTNPPASIDNISVVSDLPPPPPANDTCAGATALALNIPVPATNANANNDYSITSPTATCFPGIGQTTSTAVGRDTVYAFTAPSAGLYSFRAQFHTSLGGGNLITYLYKAAGPGYACPAAGGLTCDTSVVAANRNGNSSQWLASEEVMCQSLAAGQKVYLFVDEAAATTLGGGYIVQVNPCTQETEPNGTPATANALVSACPMEGSITPSGDADFFSLPPTTANQRIFAMADGAAGSSTDFDLRVTTSTDTLEYDDANLDAPFGGLAPTADGTKTTGTSTYIRMSHFSASTVSEPYRLYTVVRPESSQATIETEPNDTIATANVIASGYAAGTIGLSTDVDYFAVTASAGDLVFVGLDSDPGYTGAALATRLSLVDASNTALVSVADGSVTSSTRAPVAGSLTSTTPVSNGQALAWRIATAGTYYVKVEYSGGTAPKNYLLSISLNCLTGGCQSPADCNDGNVCTDDTCSAGICSHTNNTLPCASDNNVCTDDVCSGGACTHPNNTAACNDSNPCTSNDTCGGGTCIGTPNTDPCDDGNPCTTGNTCGNGICGTFNTDPCSDGNPCTIGDLCSNGVCTPGTGALPAPVQFCKPAPSQIAIPGGGLTVGNASPYPSTIAVSGMSSYTCKVTVDLSAVSHSFPDDIDVLLAGATPTRNAVIMSDVGGSTGTIATPVSLRLDDAAAASLPDAGPLVGGTFKPTNVDTADTFPAPAPATSLASPLSVFNGMNPNGTWSLYVVDDASGDSGTIAGWCLDLVAVCGADAECDDGNPCTNDTCVNSICTHANNDGAACSDGNACTANDTCSSGQCVGGPPPPCDDGNACTANNCNPATGLCENPAIVCNDNNLCTVDGCDPATGCVYTPNAAPCDDNDACTQTDLCSQGLCVGSNPVNCDDGNVCTTDSCVPATGLCVHANNTNACDDGNACTVGDVCGPIVQERFDGVVAPALPTGWTTTLVVGQAGDLAWQTVTPTADTLPNSATADDPAHITDKVLDSPPIAIASAAAVLSFRNSYSLESGFDGGVLEISIGGGAFQDILAAGGSFAAGGYNGTISTSYSSPIAGRQAWTGVSTGFPAFLTSTVHLPAAAAGQSIVLRWRVASDTSVAGTRQYVDTIAITDPTNVCIPGPSLNCDDGNPCTDDSCDPILGCVHTNNTAPCDDGNPCTGPDACANGSCQPGPLVSCDDGDACTNDFCDPQTGTCVHVLVCEIDQFPNSLGELDIRYPPNNPAPHVVSLSGPTTVVVRLQELADTNGNGREEVPTEMVQLQLSGTSPLYGPVIVTRRSPTVHPFRPTLGRIEESVNNTPGTLDLPPFTPIGMAHSFFDVFFEVELPALGIRLHNHQPKHLAGTIYHKPPAQGDTYSNPDFIDLYDDAENLIARAGPGYHIPNPPPEPHEIDIFTESRARVDIHVPPGDPTPHLVILSGPTVVDVNLPALGDPDGDGREQVPTEMLQLDLQGISPDFGPVSVRLRDAVLHPFHRTTGEIEEGANLMPGLLDLPPFNPNGPPAESFFDVYFEVEIPGLGIVLHPHQPKHMVGLIHHKPPAIGDWYEDPIIVPLYDANENLVAELWPNLHVPNPCQNDSQCDDGNPCTDDHCEQATGRCLHVDNTAPCTDGDACTVGDVCGGGVCHPGAPVICTALDQCHDAGVCDPTTGLCSNPTKPDGTACTDGNACTLGDVCVNGVCNPGTGTLDCDDHNPCTDDACDPQGGCVNANNTAPCDDGNPCTAGDVCGGGSCQPGTPVPPPPEAQALVLSPSKVTVSWAPTPGASRYDALRGLIQALPVGPGGGDEVCFDNLGAPTLNDSQVPNPGGGFWYLSRAENVCGNGTWGTQGIHGVPGPMRVTVTCP